MSGSRPFPFAVALALFLLALLPTSATSEPATRAALATQGPNEKLQTTHVYLLRGLFNVFSTGMNEIGSKLEKRGYRTTVTNHTGWEYLAEDAVKEYKSGRTRQIVIMGHSAGAVDAVHMANKIGAAGVPVSLVITFDPAFTTTLQSSNVRRAINLYMPDGIGKKIETAAGYKGKVENIDLKGFSHHMTLDKNGQVQDRAIGYLLKLKADAAADATARNPSPASRDSQLPTGSAGRNTQANTARPPQ